jgi:hypothetical protein
VADVDRSEPERHSTSEPGDEQRTADPEYWQECPQAVPCT